MKYDFTSIIDRHDMDILHREKNIFNRSLTGRQREMVLWD